MTDDTLSKEERALIEGLRANHNEGNPSETLDSDEVAMILAIVDRLTATAKDVRVP